MAAHGLMCYCVIWHHFMSPSHLKRQNIFLLFPVVLLLLPVLFSFEAIFNPRILTFFSLRILRICHIPTYQLIFSPVSLLIILPSLWEMIYRKRNIHSYTGTLDFVFILTWKSCTFFLNSIIHPVDMETGAFNSPLWAKRWLTAFSWKTSSGEPQFCFFCRI